MNTLAQTLQAPASYLAEFEQMLAKRKRFGQAAKIDSSGLSLYDCSYDRVQLCREIARAVANDEYQFGSGQLYTAWVQGKERQLIRLDVRDRLVHGVVAKAIAEVSRSTHSPRLFSYLKGVSTWDPVSDFCRYVRQHRRGLQDPKARGLYVVRRDIKSYTDSIPVGDSSYLWQRLREVCGVEEPSTEWRLIQNVVRPQLKTAEGAPFQNIRGVPTGSPITVIAYNLYLKQIDDLLQNFDEYSYYARYGDDFIFAHPNAEAAAQAATLMDKALIDLGLRFNERKKKNIFYNGAGRPGQSANFFGSTHVEFLGYWMHFNGGVGLSPQRLNLVLEQLEQRLDASCAILRRTGEDQNLLPTLCDITNAYFELNDPSAGRSTETLRRGINDRRQLAQIDFAVAERVAQAAYPAQGRRAFREVSPRELRQAGLVSLEQMRNEFGSPT